MDSPAEAPDALWGGSLDLGPAVAELRALAASSGVELRGVAPIDAAAAVVAADLWGVINQRRSLSAAGLAEGPGRALAAVLRRAAGCPDPALPVSVLPGGSPPAIFVARVGQLAGRTAAWGFSPQDLWPRVAADLALCGGPEAASLSDLADIAAARAPAL